MDLFLHHPISTLRSARDVSERQMDNVYQPPEVRRHALIVWRMLNAAIAARVHSEGVYLRDYVKPTRYSILRCTDEGGDAYWTVYDNRNRIGIGRRHYKEETARAYIAGREDADYRAWETEHLNNLDA